MVEAIFVFVFYVTVGVQGGGAFQVPVSFDTPDKCDRALNEVRIQSHKGGGAGIADLGITAACQRMELAAVRVQITPTLPRFVP